MPTPHLQTIMTVQEYIEDRLISLTTPVAVKPEGKVLLEEQIKTKLLSKKFRKLKATPACLAVIDNAVKLAIEQNKPIVLSTLFGGNKLWRFEEAPEVDWAELFNLFYYIDWAKTITPLHEPGVILDYYSQDISVESLNNIPRPETDKYSSSFRSLIEWLKPFMPEGTSVRYRRHYEEFNDPSMYYLELEKAKSDLLRENNGNYPEMSEAMRIATTMNVRTTRKQLEDPYWQEKVELEHQAIFRTPTLSRLFAENDRISLCPTDYEDSNSIITGSTKRSYAKFWAAVGALEKNDDKLGEIVLTPKQLESTSFVWENMSIEGLPGKNFSKIRVLR